MSLAGSYQGKSVFVTGHTGFKGSWLCLWLEQMGARVHGYSLPPPTSPSLFEQADVAQGIDHHVGDVRDGEALAAGLTRARPDFVFHMAAQPLVLDSYAAPAETFATNLTGTINLMEALRRADHPVAVVMVTTDKVYLNRETPVGYGEADPLGGHDPYSASKAAMEIAVASWRASYFSASSPVRVASARAGNVIGGGDWSPRIVPDLVRALGGNATPKLRNPDSVRPWQHVLEPLAGYLALGARLAGADGERFAEAWNFGPNPDETRTVRDLAEAFLARWGSHGWDDASEPGALHEAGLLSLSIDKAVAGLGWRPVWNFEQTVAHTADWYRAHAAGRFAREACLADLAAYEKDARAPVLT